MQSALSRVNVTISLLNGFRLTDPVLNLSSDGIDLPELFVPASRTPGNEGRNTAENSPPTHKHFPESVPKAGSTPSLFSHLSVSSQIGIGSRSETPSPPILQKDKSPSLKSESTRPKPTALNWKATKLTDSGTVSTELTGGLFGSTTSLPRGIISGTPSPITYSGDNPDKKPVYSGLFASVPSAAAGNSVLEIAAAKPAFGDTSSTKPSGSLFGSPKPATSLFSFASIANAGPGSASGVTTSNTSTGASGLFAGIAPAKNDNSLG
jgi:hypothetical protein